MLPSAHSSNAPILLGYANAVRKAAGSETTLPPTVSDGGAPADAAANPPATASGPQKSGAGKGGNKASNKPGNTTAAPAHKVTHNHPP